MNFNESDLNLIKEDFVMEILVRPKDKIYTFYTASDILVINYTVVDSHFKIMVI